MPGSFQGSFGRGAGSNDPMACSGSALGYGSRGKTPCRHNGARHEGRHPRRHDRDGEPARAGLDGPAERFGHLSWFLVQPIGGHKAMTDRGINPKARISLRTRSRVRMGGYTGPARSVRPEQPWRFSAALADAIMAALALLAICAFVVAAIIG